MLKKLPTLERRNIELSPRSLVTVRPLDARLAMPMLITAADTDIELDLVDWAAAEKELVDSLLDRHGAVLFRNFRISMAAQFESLIRALSGELLDYRDRATPRSAISDKIYSSTDYPADQNIELHNENCYAASFPGKIFFFCMEPAATGGATPIADCRETLRALDPWVRRRFARHGVMYVRNFVAGLGLSWQEVFQTESRSEMERFCRSSQIDIEWLGEHHLRTRQTRPALARHPRTGDLLWFNQAIAFHVSTLAPDIRRRLIDEVGEEGVPKNACYGDGEPIEEAALAAVREAYRQATVDVPWQRGDVLMVDNLRVAHGRRPYAGARKVVVGMAEPVSSADVWIEEGS